MLCFQVQICHLKHAVTAQNGGDFAVIHGIGIGGGPGNHATTAGFRARPIYCFTHSANAETSAGALGMPEASFKHCRSAALGFGGGHIATHRDQTHGVAVCIRQLVGNVAGTDRSGTAGVQRRTGFNFGGNVSVRERIRNGGVCPDQARPSGGARGGSIGCLGVGGGLVSPRTQTHRPGAFNGGAITNHCIDGAVGLSRRYRSAHTGIATDTDPERLGRGFRGCQSIYLQACAVDNQITVVDARTDLCRIDGGRYRATGGGKHPTRCSDRV